MVQTIKSQINSLKIVINKEYLKLVNITLYEEVLSKYISSSVSQFVLVALARAGMDFISKILLEMILAKWEYIRKQREHYAKQTIHSNDLTPNAFKANKTSRKSKSTSLKTDGGLNTAKADDENKMLTRKSHRLFLQCPRLLSYFRSFCLLNKL